MSKAKTPETRSNDFIDSTEPGRSTTPETGSTAVNAADTWLGAPGSYLDLGRATAAEVLRAFVAGGYDMIGFDPIDEKEDETLKKFFRGEGDNSLSHG